MSVSTPLFRQHSRAWHDNRYVYPVISRRSRGLSIGVNLSPTNACTFDCVYCMVDRSKSAESAQIDLEALTRELDQILGLAASGRIFEEPPFDRTPAELRRVNDIAFSGNGEPTASPAFAQACRIAADALERHGLAETRIVLITNATLLQRPQVREGLEQLAHRPVEIWAKLDAGTEELYRRVNRSKVPLRQVLDNLLQLGQGRPLVIQSLFMKLPDGPVAESEVAAWLDRLCELSKGGCRIDRVQLYTIARTTAVAGVLPVDDAALEAIAARVRALGLKAEIFGAPA
jgi:wyosine [tRNA(Phe)-imidazoG37] synthetase (radical SAM superfamily)